ADGADAVHRAHIVVVVVAHENLVREAGDGLGIERQRLRLIALRRRRLRARISSRRQNRSASHNSRHRGPAIEIDAHETSPCNVATLPVTSPQDRLNGNVIAYDLLRVLATETSHEPRDLDCSSAIFF